MLSLKAKVGNEATNGLRVLVGTLYNATNTTSSLGHAAKKLADAVGDKDEEGISGKPSNLRQALHQLGRASGIEIVAKANKVKDKFAGFGNDTVQKTYNDVKDDKTASTQGTFTDVTTAFDEHQFDYNKTKQTY